MPTIEQLKAEYDGEWLAILVTASDIYGATEGELFHHSKADLTLPEKFSKYLRMSGRTTI